MKGSVVEINFSELEFGDELGEGGQGTVYHGTLKPQNMVVAIKKVSGKIREEEVSAPCFPPTVKMLRTVSCCVSTFAAALT